MTLDPKSLLSFKRGIHPDWLAVDDPFQDPDNKLEPTSVLKINDVFKKQILDMPKVGGELHVVGTPQTPQDFFFDTTVMRRFSVVVQPAIISEAERIARWPEYMPFEELLERREERGAKVFNQEYICNTEDAWLEEVDVLAAVNQELPNRSVFTKHTNLTGDISAGFDIGKKRNPSHLAIYETKEGTSTQLHSMWMDGWDYTNGTGEYDPNHPTQFEYLLMAKESFGIDRLLYDATRGEFDAIADAGKMPPEFEPVLFTKKRMVGMASTLSDRMTQHTIQMLDDQRQQTQLLAVNNNLQAIETPQGHGDSFWSTAMAIPDKEEGVAFDIGFFQGPSDTGSSGAPRPASDHPAGPRCRSCGNLRSTPGRPSSPPGASRCASPPRRRTCVPADHRSGITASQPGALSRGAKTPYRPLLAPPPARTPRLAIGRALSHHGPWWPTSTPARAGESFLRCSSAPGPYVTSDPAVGRVFLRRGSGATGNTGNPPRCFPCRQPMGRSRSRGGTWRKTANSRSSIRRRSSRTSAGARITPTA